MEVYENLDLQDLDGEVWKEIEGYNGDYQVSNFGRVKSFKQDKIKGIILRQSENGNGYSQVQLYINGKSKSKQIHILMYENFNNYSLKKDECIHHKDNNKINNSLYNFQAMTKSEHARLHQTGTKHSEESKRKNRDSHLGKYKGEDNPFYDKHHSEKSKKLIRENHPNVVLTEQKVIKIRLLCDEEILTQRKIAEMFGVSPMTISDIKLRKSWKDIKGE